MASNNPDQVRFDLPGLQKAHRNQSVHCFAQLPSEEPQFTVAGTQFFQRFDFDGVRLPVTRPVAVKFRGNTFRKRLSLFQVDQREGLIGKKQAHDLRYPHFPQRQRNVLFRIPDCDVINEACDHCSVQSGGGDLDSRGLHAKQAGPEMLVAPVVDPPANRLEEGVRGKVDGVAERLALGELQKPHPDQLVVLAQLFSQVENAAATGDNDLGLFKINPAPVAVAGGKQR